MSSLGDAHRNFWAHFGFDKKSCTFGTICAILELGKYYEHGNNYRFTY